MAKNSLSVIVKPTHDCNLACKYCYLGENAGEGRMNYETLKNMIQQLLTLPDRERIHFIWHGGEPLLMGRDFYEEAVRLQDKYRNNRVVENAIQTNGTLINDDILDFCEEHEFNVGSSIDGPKEIHDRVRVYPDEKGSFEDAWSGLMKVRERSKHLRESGKKKWPRGGAIAVLSKANIGEIERVYAFFRGNNITVKMNPLIKSGRAKEHHDLAIGPLEYGTALVKVFDEWFNEENAGIDVEPLSMILGNLMTGKPVGCNFGDSCREGFISVGPKGEIYPCGRFDRVEEFRLGNVNEEGLQRALDLQEERIERENRSNSAGCRNCDYSNICNAGCMHSAFMRRGNPMDKDYYCASYRVLFKHLEKALDKELEGVPEGTNK